MGLNPDPLHEYDPRRGQNSHEYAAWIISVLWPRDNIAAELEAECGYSQDEWDLWNMERG